MNYEIMKFYHGNIELDIRVSNKEETAWLTKEQIAILFGRDRSVISKHINNIYKENELEKASTCAKNAHVQLEGNRTIMRNTEFYNLDVIISIGYRVKSQMGLLLKEKVLDYLSNKESANNSVIVYNNGDVRIDVQIEPKKDTVWLSANQMSLLFETTTDNIYLHIKNIYEEGEIPISVAEDSSVTRKEMIQVAADGKSYLTNLYNLDVVLAVGYRVKGKRAIEFRRWASSVLREYLLKGYVIDEKRTLVTNENYINLINRVNSIDNRLSKLEQKDDYLFLKNKFIYDGQIFDGIAFINQIVERAKETIVLIDPYLDVKTLNAFKEKPFNVKLTVVASFSNTHLSKRDIGAFNKQYGNLIIKYSNKNHDRYLVIDNKMFYHLGTSINYLGNKFSQISLVEENDIIETLRTRIRNYE